MRPLHFALLLTLGLGTWQTRGFAQTAPSTLSSQASAPAATALLDNAIKAFSRPQGVEIRFHQEVFGQSDPVIFDGRTITADQDRVFVELDVRQVRRSGKMKLYCDGKDFHRIEVIEPRRTITSYSLNEVHNVLEGMAQSETERLAREDVEKELRGVNGLDGLPAMLKGLKQRAVFMEPAAGTLDTRQKKGLAVKIVTGTWNQETLDAIAPPKMGDNPNQPDLRYLWNEKRDFFYFPRSVKLYFDNSGGQLARLEMLGIQEAQGPEKVLISIDFEQISPVATLDPNWFVPTEAELKYTASTVDLRVQIKELYQRALQNLKRQDGALPPRSIGP